MTCLLIICKCVFIMIVDKFCVSILNWFSLKLIDFNFSFCEILLSCEFFCIECVNITLLGFIMQSWDQGKTESTDIYCWPVRLQSNTSIVWSDPVWYYKDIVYIARAGEKVLDCSKLFSIKCWWREISKILTLLHK